MQLAANYFCHVAGCCQVVNEPPRTVSAKVHFTVLTFCQTASQIKRRNHWP